jgi:integrase
VLRFRGRRGDSIVVGRATKCFLRALDRAGIRRFRLHDLRHFMATELLQAGVALAVVSQRLDHQRKSTTLDYYAHTVPSGDLHAADMMRSILDNQPKLRELRGLLVS